MLYENDYSLYDGETDDDLNFGYADDNAVMDDEPTNVVEHYENEGVIANSQDGNQLKSLNKKDDLDLKMDNQPITVSEKFDDSSLQEIPLGRTFHPSFGSLSSDNIAEAEKWNREAEHYEKLAEKDLRDAEDCLKKGDTSGAAMRQGWAKEELGKAEMRKEWANQALKK
ncbi:hypothetical protein FACS189416_3800 [Bacteroidia bacterium]|nr:hypothetical protein FACS189416_3800 [Bacteroidia bacterium]